MSVNESFGSASPSTSQRGGLRHGKRASDLAERAKSLTELSFMNLPWKKPVLAKVCDPSCSGAARCATHVAFCGGRDRSQWPGCLTFARHLQALQARRLAMADGGRGSCRCLASRMDSLGVGIGLHFRIVCYFFIFFCAAAIASVPLLVIAGRGTRVSVDEEDPIHVSDLSIANIGDRTSLLNYTISLAGKSLTAVEISRVAVVTDCVVVALAIVLMLVLKAAIPAVTANIEDVATTAADYTVFVTDLPEDVTEDELAAHFGGLYDLRRPDWVWPSKFKFLYCGRKTAARRRLQYADAGSPDMHQILEDDAVARNYEPPPRQGTVFTSATGALGGGAGTTAGKQTPFADTADGTGTAASEGLMGGRVPPLRPVAAAPAADPSVAAGKGATRDGAVAEAAGAEGERETITRVTRIATQGDVAAAAVTGTTVSTRSLDAPSGRTFATSTMGRGLHLARVGAQSLPANVTRALGGGRFATRHLRDEDVYPVPDGGELSSVQRFPTAMCACRGPHDMLCHC